jgi:hypothetical protein
MAGNEECVITELINYRIIHYSARPLSRMRSSNQFEKEAENQNCDASEEDV